MSAFAGIAAVFTQLLSESRRIVPIGRTWHLQQVPTQTCRRGSTHNNAVRCLVCRWLRRLWCVHLCHSLHLPHRLNLVGNFLVTHGAILAWIVRWTESVESALQLIERCSRLLVEFLVEPLFCLLLQLIHIESFPGKRRGRRLGDRTQDLLQRFPDGDPVGLTPDPCQMNIRNLYRTPPKHIRVQRGQRIGEREPVDDEFWRITGAGLGGLAGIAFQIVQQCLQIGIGTHRNDRQIGSFDVDGVAAATNFSAVNMPSFFVINLPISSPTTSARTLTHTRCMGEYA